uniref:Uncharacterized protein n=1 Tax=Anopheles merus TaxID=30066 RepID=A0A182USG7_ANOME
MPAAASRHMPIICRCPSVLAFLRRNMSSDPPATSSITIIIGCFCTQMPISLTMFGWSYCFRMRPSCRNLRFCSSGSVIRHVLTATSVFFDDFSLALYTSPKLPRPILSSRITSSLLSSQRSRRTGLRSTAPERPVTGSSDWYWCTISSSRVSGVMAARVRMRFLRTGGRGGNKKL